LKAIPNKWGAILSYSRRDHPIRFVAHVEAVMASVANALACQEIGVRGALNSQERTYRIE